MACCNLLGGAILAVLREKRNPLTYAEMLELISRNLNVPNYYIKSTFTVALDLAYTRGFVQKNGFHYRMKTDFRGIPLRSTLEAVLAARQDQPNNEEAGGSNLNLNNDPSVVEIINPAGIPVIYVPSGNNLQESTSSVMYMGTTMLTPSDPNFRHNMTIKNEATPLWKSLDYIQ